MRRFALLLLPKSSLVHVTKTLGRQRVTYSMIHGLSDRVSGSNVSSSGQFGERNGRAATSDLSMIVTQLGQGLFSSAGPVKYLTPKDIKRLHSAAEKALNTSATLHDIASMANLLRRVQNKSDHVEYLACLCRLLGKHDPATSLMTVHQVAICIGALRHVSSDPASLSYLGLLNKHLTAHKDAVGSLRINFRAASFALMGLQNFSDTDTEAISLLEHLNPHIRAAIPTVDPNIVCSAVWGLRNKSEKHSAVVELISILAAALDHVDVPTEHVICGALRATQGLEANSHPTKLLLSRLTSKIKKSARMTSSELCPAYSCFLLMGLQSDHARNLMEQMNIKLETCTGAINADMVSKLLYYLQRCWGDEPGIRKLLSIVTPRLKEASGTFTPSQISDIFCGIQNVKSNNEISAEFISVLADVVRNCSGEFTAPILSTCLFGMHHLSDTAPATRELMKVLEYKLTNFTGDFTVKELTSSFLGFSSMSCTGVETESLLSHFLSLLNRTKPEHIPEVVGHVLMGTQSMNAASPVVQSLLTTVHGLLRKSMNEYFSEEVLRKCYLGLQKKHAGNRQVRGILTFLNLHLERLDTKPSIEVLADMMYGLQSMSETSREVMDAILLLTSMLDYSAEMLPADIILRFLRGTARIKSSSTITELLSVLSKRMGIRTLASLRRGKMFDRGSRLQQRLLIIIRECLEKNPQYDVGVKGRKFSQMLEKKRREKLDQKQKELPPEKWDIKTIMARNPGLGRNLQDAMRIFNDEKFEPEPVIIDEIFDSPEYFGKDFK